MMNATTIRRDDTTSDIETAWTIAVHAALYEGLPEGTVLQYESVGSHTVSIESGDLPALAAALGLPADSDRWDIQRSLEERAEDLAEAWTRTATYSEAYSDTINLCASFDPRRGIVVCSAGDDEAGNNFESEDMGPYDSIAEALDAERDRLDEIAAEYTQRLAANA